MRIKSDHLLSLLLCAAVVIWAGQASPPRSDAGPASPERAAAEGKKSSSNRVEGRSRSANPDGARREPAHPSVAYEDLVLLVRNARRAFGAKVSGLPERSAGYRPPELAGLTGAVHVVLRSHGVVVAEAESAEMDIVDASVAAGTLLAQAVLAKRDGSKRGANGADRAIRDGGDGYGLEFEWLGAREYLNDEPGGIQAFGEGGEWTEALLHAFEPAVEGIGVAFRGRRGWTRPSEIVSTAYTPDMALKAAESAIGLRHNDKVRFGKDIRYYRFWAYHLWQPEAHGLPTVLVRGDVLTPPESAKPESVDAAIIRLGNYLSYRQNSNGGFSHEYLPGADRYSEGSSARVQLRALQGLAAYAVWPARSPAATTRPADDIAGGARRAIDNLVKYLEPLVLRRPGDQKGETKEEPAGLLLMPPGHSGYLEISARLLSAMQSIDSADTLTGAGTDNHAEQITGLIDALLAAQDDEGRLFLPFEQGEAGLPGAAAKPRRDTGAGWALLALAEAHALNRDPRIEKALLRSLSYYRRGFRERLSWPGTAALARALTLHYAQTNDARLSDAVFEIIDRFVELQVTRLRCPYPELRGAINVRRPGQVGADTAIYLAALADALLLAERVGDRRRAATYRNATLSAVRFVLQLEVREMGCYYIRSPRDALGGVRTAPWDGRIRVDHCADALRALQRARIALYGKPH